MAMITQKTRQVYLTSMLLLVVVYFIIGFYPFKFLALSVGQHDNGAEFTPEGSLHFRSPGIAQTLTAPAWLQKAITKSDFELSLEVRTTDQEQYGPARIFTLSENPSHRNITVGQEGTNLIVRVRTQRTSLNGTPDYLIKKFFLESGWHSIDVLVTGKTLEIHVDEDSLVIERLTDQALDAWDSGYRLALGNELTGDRPWLGEIRK
ncbi:MAG: hypothetical protein U9R43_12195, partial [Thermodesulfobacteriota bacterium]|nr:hypothetical protein [Thermodesulfobacteriota bacterium]